MKNKWLILSDMNHSYKDLKRANVRASKLLVYIKFYGNYCERS